MLEPIAGGRAGAAAWLARAGRRSISPDVSAAASEEIRLQRLFERGDDDQVVRADLGADLAVLQLQRGILVWGWCSSCTGNMPHHMPVGLGDMAIEPVK